MLKHFLLLWVSICLIGCTTTHAMPVSTLDRDDPPFKRGETLTLVMTDGTERKVTYRRATEEALITRDGPIPWDDIAQVRDRDFSAGKTAGAGALTYLVLVGLGMLLLGKAIEEGFSSDDD